MLDDIRDGLINRYLKIYLLRQKNLYIYNSSVRVFVTELLLNGWTDFDEIFCVCSRGSENGLDSQFCPLDNVFLINF